MRSSSHRLLTLDGVAVFAAAVAGTTVKCETKKSNRTLPAHLAEEDATPRRWGRAACQPARRAAPSTLPPVIAGIGATLFRKRREIKQMALVRSKITANEVAILTYAPTAGSSQ